MSKLTIVANIIAKQDKIEVVKSELIKLIEPTRLEEGCIDYDLHQDNENPAHFVFLENWTSRDLLQKHLQSEHIAAYKAATAGAVESFNLNELTHIA
ncbi:putative quinol monooxygenase [Vibrio sp. MarTm2]|uniref:putative quinol monooxygenase n=1 Tax=Vibrio sp. MarTm2 TaxID=2998831 RepID=UPI0022CD42E6|nr:putative quinol monooxygenase [Vibrio sp. MarTm2]MDA0128241.1 putative quinol monooxygenase [Vibrio sp. MarTm2]